MTNSNPPAKSNVAIVGGGSIGVAFALVFARAKFAVTIFEPDKNRREKIYEELRTRLSLLGRYDLLLGEDPHSILDRIMVADDLRVAVHEAVLVQECVPENLNVKRDLFKSLAPLIRADCIVASSTSFIPTSESSADTGLEDRSIVAHPGNPPYALPVIELVPNPRTDPEVLDAAKEIYSSIGMSPVIVNAEIEGFLFNRIQGAVLREAYALVRDGIASVDDIDKVVRDGLGRRWCFMGPFETVDLNTRGGISAHAERMGPSYQRMGRERGDDSSWSAELVSEVEAQRRQLLDLSDWDDRVIWRDNELLKRLSENRDSINNDIA